MGWVGGERDDDECMAPGKEGRESLVRDLKAGKCVPGADADETATAPQCLPLSK